MLVIDGARGDMSGDDAVARRDLWRLLAAERRRGLRDAAGNLKLWGNNLTVSAMRVELLNGVHTLWQR